MYPSRFSSCGKSLLIFLLSALIATPAALYGCMDGPVQQETEITRQVGVTLNFPDGYNYDPATGALYPPSGHTSASLPSYVTSMVLVISGPGMADQSFPVNLTTLTVTFTITPGMRTFSIIVTTTIGTFTDSVTIEVVSGGALNLGFNLIINAPPSVSGISATPSIAAPGDVIALSCQGADWDAGDHLAYDWTGPGGWTAQGQQAVYTIPSYGSFTFTCVINDGWGGRASASVTVKAPAPPPPPPPPPGPGNQPPVISSINIIDPQSGLTPRSIWGGMLLNISCIAIDPEADPLTYVLGDQFGVIANSSAVVNYPAPNIAGCEGVADWSVACVVTDGKNAAVSATITVQVWGSCAMNHTK
ncbi:MAG: hypothetical protein OEZ32_02895 [Nitrospinota bacterium]|nr:hypothetical protein [Nitrospinota bacterium]